MSSYLDHNATTSLLPEARRALLEAAEAGWGNPSSVHRAGQIARLIVEEARARVASLVDAEASEVVFTASGTEADNLALRGVLESRPGAHLVISALEHEAVAECAALLARRGHRLTVVPPEPDGRVATGRIREALRPETALVSLIHGSHLVGTLQPVAEVARLCGERGILVHSDGVQTAGRVPLSFRRLGVDLLAVSAHKMGGAKGAGALVVRRGVRLEPLVCGGGQEFRRRSGTEAVPAVAAFGAAAAAAPGRARAWRRTAVLRDRLEREVERRVPGARALAAGARRLPNTSALLLPGVRADEVTVALDLHGFAVSAGSACHSGAPRPPEALASLGLTPSETGSVLRVSLGPGNTSEELEAFAGALSEVLAAAVAGEAAR